VARRLACLGCLGLAAIGVVLGVPLVGLITQDGARCKCGPPERSAWITLRSVVTSQSLFREGDKENDGALDYAASFAELGAAGLVDGETAQGRHAGYRFEVVRATEFEWSARATPVQARDPINLRLKGPFRALWVDHTGLIRGRPSPNGEVAGPDDPLVSEPR
jgi:hypothetical protein